MSRLTAVDLAFLVLESPSRPTHMAGFQVFRLPVRGRKTFIPRLLAAYRGSEIGKPFNQKLKWQGRGLASWEMVEPDPRFHIRHLAVPAPGRMEDFYNIVSFLNSSLLDRNRPLWECYVIEGLEDDQFAIFTKIHHALIDGMGAMKLTRRALSNSPRDRAMRPVWVPGEEPPRRKRSRSDKSQLQKLVKGLGSLPSGLIDFGGGMIELGMQKLQPRPQKSPPPFSAERTLFNNAPTSSERRYGSCELPIEGVKAIAKATETTVNDVMMTLIDDALHRYLKQYEAPANRPLVTLMAMSFRSEKPGASGNQVSQELVTLGEPDARLQERLQQIHAATTSVKASSGKLPVAVRQLYALLLSGTGTLPELSAAFKAIPNYNLIISNMVGPREQLYLAGAPMVVSGGLPIVPPGCGLNVTFGSVNQSISLAVGAAPEAVEDPTLITGYITQAFTKLERATTLKPGAGKSARR